VVPKPQPGIYDLLMVAKEDFGELLLTAIMDTPPAAEERPNFVIRRMGQLLDR